MQLARLPVGTGCITLLKLCSDIKAQNFPGRPHYGMKKNRLERGQNIGISTTHDFLLQSEDVVVEELVQLFVGVIYAQLLERVADEILKTEYVEHSQEASRVLAGVGARVDVVHQPGERPRVQRLRHRMPVLLRLEKLMTSGFKYKYLL